MWTPHRGPSTREVGVAAAIRKVGSSIAKGPDRLTLLHLRHLGEHGLTFLTELFNLSVARVDVPVIRKNSVIMEATRPGSFLPPHLTALPGSEDIGVAPPPVRRESTMCTLIPARLQTEALHRLGPAQCSSFLLGWFLASTSISPLAEQ